jgi:photosynthetic reaction center cytochrome c subunit
MNSAQRNRHACRARSATALVGLGGVLLSCQRGALPSAAPRPLPATVPADSVATTRNRLLQEVLVQVAGREKEPASLVFKNVKLLGAAPAENFVRAMGFYGRSLGVSCSHCHVVGQWDREEKSSKRIARQMIAMVDTINERLLANIPELRARNPSVSCMTCHREHTRP